MNQRKKFSIKNRLLRASALAIFVLHSGVASASEEGEAKPSMDEIAKELANPNTSVASLTFKTQFRTFEGDLGDADEQSSTTLLFQPALPFKRDDGSKIIWRPAVPFLVDQPLFEGGSDWDEESGMGDISFDLAYAFAPEKDDPGKLVAVGIFSSLPTGDDDLGFGETTTLGPELLYGRISKEKIWGLFPSHQWDIDGDVDVSLTSLQIFCRTKPRFHSTSPSAKRSPSADARGKSALKSITMSSNRMPSAPNGCYPSAPRRWSRTRLRSGSNEI
jgi:hypothetical protein